MASIFEIEEIYDNIGKPIFVITRNGVQVTSR